MARELPIDSTDGTRRDQLAALVADLPERDRQALLNLIEAMAVAPVESRTFQESMIRRLANLTDMTRAQRRREIDRATSLLLRTTSATDGEDQ